MKKDKIFVKKSKMKSSSSFHKFDNKKKSSCSWVVLCSWFLVTCWMILVYISWRSGLLQFASITSLSGSTSYQLLSEEINHLSEDISTFVQEHGIQTEKFIPEPYDIHVIFSTDCSAFQDWQTLVLFYSAKVVGQKGPVTRIASGCDEDKQRYLTALYQNLYPKYHVHFTPSYSKDEKTGQNYHFYNKPWGLKHWLENAQPPIPDDVIIALLDPDMIFLRPITTQIRGQINNIHSRKIDKDTILEKISKGNPVGQLYGLGAPWANDNHPKFNRGKICGEGSPCLKPSQAFGEDHYAVGPPYIAHKDDMIHIASSWTKFVPKVYEGYPYLLAEMYAYSMAAAHENLPHLQLENYMVSNVHAGGEGWPWVDKIDNVLKPPLENGTFFPDEILPNVVHYCQSFRIHDISFYKRGLRKDIFSCEAPLLVDPPVTLDLSEYETKKSDGEVSLSIFFL